MAARLEKVLVKVDLRVEDVLFAIQRHIRADHHDLSEVLDADGNLRNPTLLTPDVAMNIGGFDIVKRNLTSGDGKVDEVIKVKVRDQSRYVEMGAKYFGILKEQVHLTAGWSIACSSHRGDAVQMCCNASPCQVIFEQ